MFCGQRSKTSDTIHPMHIASLLLALTFLGAPHGNTGNASKALSRLETKAGREHKNVFLVFHASWCGWCHKLDQLMNDSRFKNAFGDNYEVLQVDVMENGPKKSLETPGGLELMKAAGGEGQGLPYYAIYSPKGSLLMDSKNPANIGYPSQPSEISYFIKLLETTAPAISATQLSSLKTYLEAQKS